MTSVKHVHKKYVSKPATSSDWKNIYVVRYWTNCTGLIIPPLIASVGMSIVGNVVYMCLNEVPVGLRTYGLLLSRFLNGAGSGNRGTYFAYIAAASDPSDRARSMALSGGGALIGLNIGPAAQMLFTWIGGEGVDVGFMRISMYTAPAVLAIVINIACVIFLVFCLEDGLDRYNVPETDNVSTYSIAAASDSDLGSTHGWDWCETLRPINFWVYYVGYALIFGIGLPCLNNSLQSLYSQILGKGRQGTMQGINQAAGCVSRILGPLLMSSTFSSFGPRATWLIEIGLISICLFIW
ncbi:hypothetical protein TELCIR_13129 [Teladorsagia circumcincta]|uniref:Major facilitator superfamily (MFS) profile domain-containing protein n=1 Tax=Teladorsagia circumcincta TaxID=45464 RepID=A0A2G9U4W0_TELCI|nr:hypothetical protein TELCIR_13129 [Teladorsagia circumcincta]